MENTLNRIMLANHEPWLKELENARYKLAVDIGANTGGYARAMADRGFEVLAFEPVKAVYDEMLEHNKTAKNNHLIRTYPFALSDADSTLHNVQVLMCWTLAPEGTGGLETSAEYKGKPSFSIETRRLDGILEAENVKNVGFVKLDVDGYEPWVLRGARRMLLRDRPSIMCEFSAYPEKLGTPIECFVNQIFDLGYVIASPDRSVVLDRWSQVHPIYPYHTSYDVMLIPAEAVR